MRNQLRKFVAYFGWALLFLPLAGYGQVVPEWEAPYEKISDAWQVRKEVIAVTPDSVASKELDQILTLKRQFGMTSLPLVSIALLREIQERGWVGKPEGIQLVEYASKLSPALEAVDYFFCSKAQLFAQPREAAKRCIRGLVKEFSQNEGRARMFTNLFFALRWIALSLLSLFFIFILISYAHPLCHHWAHRIRGASPLGIFSLALSLHWVVFLFFGWVGALLLFIGLIWRYITLPEKCLATFLLLVIAALPFGLYFPALQMEYEKGIHRQLGEPLEGPFLSDTAYPLQRWIAANPNDAEALFVLSQIERRAGRLLQAKELLGRVTQLRPKWYKPLVNLAVIDFISGDSEAAVLNLKKATSMAPSALIPNFNLGKIFFKQARLDEGIASLRKAKEINAELFAQLDGISDPNDPAQFIFDENLSEDEILPRIWSFSSSLVQPRNNLFASVSPPLSPSIFWFMMGGSLVLNVLLSWFFPAVRLPRRCQKCGLPSCTLCDPAVEHESLCTQCYHMFVRLESTEPEARQKKQKMISRYNFVRDIRERWIAFVVPGMHSFFHGDLIRAVFFSSLASASVFVAFAGDELLMGRYMLPGLPTLPYFWIGLTLFGAVYLLSLLDAVKR